ncbi:MAG: hypothetical protein ACLRFI_02090 [Alphaproteobacteria bacterium]
MNKKISVLSLLVACIFVQNADAIQFSRDRFAMRLSGYGTAGIIEPDFNKPDFIGDWSFRTQLNYATTGGQTAGLVYVINQEVIDEDEFIHELFGLYEIKNLGRIELGFTESIAEKLGTGLPDVGGMRVNHKPLFYKKIHPKGSVIPNAMVSTGHDALRVNIVSAPRQGAQYGLSVSGITDDYDYAVDGGIKFRYPNGKLKTAISLGASFMDNPNGYHTADYTTEVYADWRAQASVGFNLQYNSIVWATTGTVIYDKDPIGDKSGDGVSVGTGVSYDLLNSSFSLSYILSQTGIWDSNIKNYTDNTLIASFRYKYNQYIDMWTSVGITTETPFVSAALRLTF